MALALMRDLSAAGPRRPLDRAALAAAGVGRADSAPLRARASGPRLSPLPHQARIAAAASSWRAVAMARARRSGSLARRLALLAAACGALAAATCVLAVLDTPMAAAAAIDAARGGAGRGGGGRALLGPEDSSRTDSQLQSELDQPFTFNATSTLALVLAMIVSCCRLGGRQCSSQALRRAVCLFLLPAAHLMCPLPALHCTLARVPPPQVSVAASAVGVGGGPIYVPLFSALLGWGLKAAAGLSSAAITAASIGAVGVRLASRHPALPHRPLVDYRLALLLAGPVNAGVMAGVLLNIMLPDWCAAVSEGRLRCWLYAARRLGALGVACSAAALALPHLQPPLDGPASRARAHGRCRPLQHPTSQAARLPPRRPAGARLRPHHHHRPAHAPCRARRARREQRRRACRRRQRRWQRC